jgi:Protein of unknown function (DUF3105)
MRRLLLTLAACSTVAVSACGGSSTSGSVAGPKVGFVGNSSCPTANATPYNNGNAPNTNGPAVGQAIAEMPHTHVQPPAPVNYLHDPPTSGCHYNLPATGTGLSAPIEPGVYDQSIPAEYWVHNLEHGYVVVLYNCPSGCQTQFNQLHAWYKGLSPDPQLNSSCPQAYNLSAPYAKVLVLPETTMKPQFAVVSWDWYDPMAGGLDLNEVQKFYNNHLDQAPEAGVC